MKKVMTPEQFILSLKAIVGCWTIDELDEDSYADKVEIILKWSKEIEEAGMSDFAESVSQKEYAEVVIDYLDNLKPENLL